MIRKFKYICNKCIDEGLAEEPCKLKFRNDFNPEFAERLEALRRCPFENTKNGKLTGYVPLAEWVEQK